MIGSGPIRPLYDRVGWISAGPLPGGRCIEADIEGVKRLRHPTFGEIELEYASFSVDGRPDLGLLIYTPVARSAAEAIRAQVALRMEMRAGLDCPPL